MQVDQKPSPWPCVVMLVGLLACCLTVPLYWRPSAAPDRPPATASISAKPERTTTGPIEANRSHPATFGLPTIPASRGISLDTVLVQPPARLVGNNNWLSLCPPPTIEELVAVVPIERDAIGCGNRLAANRLVPLADHGLSAEFGSEDVWPTTDSQIAVASEEPNPLIAAALERVGTMLVTYSISDAVIRWVVRSGELHELVRNIWSSQSSVVSQLHPATFASGRNGADCQRADGLEFANDRSERSAGSVTAERPSQHPRQHTR